MKLISSFISRTTFSVLLILLSFQGFGNIISTSCDRLVSMDLVYDSDYDYISKEFYRYLFSKPDSAFILLEQYCLKLKIYLLIYIFIAKH